MVTLQTAGSRISESALAISQDAIGPYANIHTSKSRLSSVMQTPDQRFAQKIKAKGVQNRHKQYLTGSQVVAEARRSVLSVELEPGSERFSSNRGGSLSTLKGQARNNLNNFSSINLKSRRPLVAQNESSRRLYDSVSNTVPTSGQNTRRIPSKRLSVAEIRSKAAKSTLHLGQEAKY